MTAGAHDITIEQGATFTMNIRWADSTDTPVDLTGYTARMQVRLKHATTTTLLSLTSAGGEITLGGVLGTIDIEASAVLTAALPAPKVCVYDLELVDSSSRVTRLIEGAANITPEVTR